jgi:hypothetical protein
MPTRDFPLRKKSESRSIAEQRLLRSPKFIAWHPKPAHRKALTTIVDGQPAQERIFEVHFTPARLAKEWAVSTDTIRHLFYDEPGVLKIDRPETMRGGKDGKGKRRYRSIRIPQSVAAPLRRTAGDRVSARTETWRRTLWLIFFTRLQLSAPVRSRAIRCKPHHHIIISSQGLVTTWTATTQPTQSTRTHMTPRIGSSRRVA